MGWPLVILLIGAGATAALLARALIGDRSRGRRRCPSCWYDMGSTAGLACPECGHDAEREAGLLRTRRRKLNVAAAFMPLIAAGVTWSVGYFRRPDWYERAPLIVLVAASPWITHHDAAGRELDGRLGRMDEPVTVVWEHWPAKQISRFMIWADGSPTSVLFHTWILSRAGGADESIVPILLSLTRHSDTQVADEATFALGVVYPCDAAEAELVKLTTDARPAVQTRAVDMLFPVKRDRPPGGEAPAALLAQAAQTADEDARARACRTLGLYAPTPEIRELLLSAAASSDWLLRTFAIVSLTSHSPGDEHAQKLLVALLRDPSEQGKIVLVKELFRADRWGLDDRGVMRPERARLYSDGVRAAILNCEAASRGTIRSNLWNSIRTQLRSHPCFTPEERAGIPSETVSPAP